MMNNNPNVIKLNDIQDRLNSLDSTWLSYSERTLPESHSVDSPYIEAAAVLATYNVDELKPSQGNSNIMSDDTRKKYIGELIGSSDIKLNQKTEKFEDELSYYLKDGVRNTVLKKLIKENRVRTALNANENITFGSNVLLQNMLTRCLLGEVPQLDDLEIEGLSALQKVCKWLEGTRITLHDTRAITQQMGYLEIVAPFRHLTGRYVSGVFEEQFRGRKNELAILRRYAGVSSPQSTLEYIQRYIIEPVFNWDKKPPLFIFGLGGVGKSALLGKFILEQAEVLKTNKFPFAYLDFDRPTLNAFEPATLLVEAARQISLQYSYPEDIYSSFVGYYDKWKNEQFGGEEKSSESLVIKTVRQSQQSAQDRGIIFNEFIDIFKKHSGIIGNRPFLAVIDTFEEVQYKGQECCDLLFEFLQKLQGSYPMLRVVIAGRAPVKNIKTEELELRDLDQEAAIGYLTKAGISDPAELKSIAEKVGGNPLALKLAAELVKNYGTAELEQLSLSKKKYYWFEEGLPTNQKQGILYRRILGHIRNLNIRSLAHPGLVLREITADLIYGVLAEPCGLKISSESEAWSLFLEMSKEVSLVTLVNSSTLKHRADVRKVMLELIKQDKPNIVDAIHRKAVDYYAGKDGLACRAEEFYHRLSLNESPRLLDNRWTEGIQNYLLGSIDELPPKAQAYLVGRTGINISDSSVWDHADVEDEQRKLIRTAVELLNSGNAKRTLAVISNVSNLASGKGVFALLKLRALLMLERNDEAKKLVKDTLHSYYADTIDPLIKAEFASVSARLNASSGNTNRNKEDDSDQMESSFELIV